MENTYITRAEYNKDIKRLEIKNEAQDAELKKIHEDIAETRAIYKVLSDVPDTTMRIREEQIKISSTFTVIVDKLDAVSKEVSAYKESMGREIKSIMDVVNEKEKDIHMVIEKKESTLHKNINSIRKEQEEERENSRIPVTVLIRKIIEGLIIAGASAGVTWLISQSVK